MPNDSLTFEDKARALVRDWYNERADAARANVDRYIPGEYLRGSHEILVRLIVELLNVEVAHRTGWVGWTYHGPKGA